MKQNSNIKSIAALAGVSPSTVSRVLNQSAGVSDELRERVMNAINVTGYTINPMASTLKSTKRNQIAIVIPSLRKNYYVDIIRAASLCCYERGIMPVILESSGDPSEEIEIIRRLETQWIDGIIFVPSKAGKLSRDAVASLSSLSKQQERIPVVLVESETLNPLVDCVRVDYQYGFYTLASHILETGRKKLAYLCGEKDATAFHMSLCGVKQALEEHGMVLEDRYVVCGGFKVIDGYRCMNDLVSRGIPFDAVICANDQMASGALGACREHGLEVPGDVALAGFGGVALSAITTPPITTMVVPSSQLGYRAAMLLFERINNRIEQAEEIVMKPVLAVRPSTLDTAAISFESMLNE